MISREAPAVMNLLKALSLLASDALVRTPVANSDVQSRLILEMTWGDDLNCLRRIHRESGRQQTNGQISTNEMDTGRRSFVVAGPHSGIERRFAWHILPL